MTVFAHDFMWQAIAERAKQPRREARRQAPRLLLQDLEGGLLRPSTLAAIAGDLRHCAAALSLAGRAALDDVADQIDHHVRARRLYGERPWR